MESTYFALAVILVLIAAYFINAVSRTRLPNAPRADELVRLTQIVRVPPHAGSDPHHEDCENGFIVRAVGGDVFLCHFFEKKSNFKKRDYHVRTIAGAVNVHLSEIRLCRFMNEADLVKVSDSLDIAAIIQEAANHYPPEMFSGPGAKFMPPNTGYWAGGKNDSK